MKWREVWRMCRWLNCADEIGTLSRDSCCLTLKSKSKGITFGANFISFDSTGSENCSHFVSLISRYDRFKLLQLFLDFLWNAFEQWLAALLRVMTDSKLNWLRKSQFAFSFKTLRYSFDSFAPSLDRTNVFLLLDVFVSYCAQVCFLLSSDERSVS